MSKIGQHQRSQQHNIYGYVNVHLGAGDRVLAWTVLAGPSHDRMLREQPRTSLARDPQNVPRSSSATTCRRVLLDDHLLRSHGCLIVVGLAYPGHIVNGRHPL